MRGFFVHRGLPGPGAGFQTGHLRLRVCVPARDVTAHRGLSAATSKSTEGSASSLLKGVLACQCRGGKRLGLGQHGRQAVGAGRGQVLR